MDIDAIDRQIEDMDLVNYAEEEMRIALQRIAELEEENERLRRANETLVDFMRGVARNIMREEKLLGQRARNRSRSQANE